MKMNRGKVRWLTIASLVGLLMLNATMGCVTVLDTASPPPGQATTHPMPPLSIPELDPEPVFPVLPSDSPALAPLSLEERVAAMSPEEASLPSESQKVKQYSFRVQNVPLHTALALFARVNKLNIVVGPKVQGTTTVDFHDLTLDKTMDAFLNPHGFYWVQDGNLIQISRLETRIFSVDYIRLVHSGSGRSLAQITAGGGSGPS